VTEWKLFTGATPHVSTLAFHEYRERAPHLEQPDHRQRLETCAHLIHDLKPASVVDLGCGDGGLLSLIRDIPSWGYDFQPANADGWTYRGVTAEQRDVFNTLDVPRWGDVVVMTEVLEHLADPHTVVEWVSRHTKWVIASSPKDETGAHHGDCHAWAWDLDGYRALFDPHFHIASHTTVDWSQIIAGRSRHT
jgi:SAM-dependent methyltransferase